MSLEASASTTKEQPSPDDAESGLRRWLVDVECHAVHKCPSLDELQLDRIGQVLEQRQPIAQRDRVDDEAVFIYQAEP
jgi:hypothetical protein